MSRRTKKATRHYCSICNELESVRRRPDYQAAVRAIFGRQDRIRQMHAAYGRRR